MKCDISYIESKSRMEDTNPTMSVTALIMNRLNSRIKKQTLLRRELYFIFRTLNFLSLLGYRCLTHNTVIVSGENWRYSVIHTHASILPQTPVPSRLPSNTEQSVLSYTIGPRWPSALNTALGTWQSQTPELSFRLTAVSLLSQKVCFVTSFGSLLFLVHIEGMPFKSSASLSDWLNQCDTLWVGPCCCKWP